MNSSLRMLAAAALFSLGACASHQMTSGFDAYGYLSPSLDAEGELIGHYQSREECEAAGDAWMSQQVVGNPVRAECYPVDRH